MFEFLGATENNSYQQRQNLSLAVKLYAHSAQKDYPVHDHDYNAHNYNTHATDDGHDHSRWESNTNISRLQHHALPALQMHLLLCFFHSKHRIQQKRP